MTMSDVRVSPKIVEAKKPIDRVQSLAEMIIFSMSEDAPAAPVASAAATPGNVTPMPAAVSRLQQTGPAMNRSSSADSLAAAGKKSDDDRKFVGGSKALDHLSRLLTSLETVSRGMSILSLTTSSSTQVTLVPGVRTSLSSSATSAPTSSSVGNPKKSQCARRPKHGALRPPSNGSLYSCSGH